MPFKIVVIVLSLSFCFCTAFGEMLCDHEVVLDAEGKLLPWTSYDQVMKGSVAYLEHCPRKHTALGNDPWYLITSKLNPDATFKYNQNNQGSNTYYAVDLLCRYYAYSGDRALFTVTRTLVDRVLMFRTPSDWAWANVPRTQDNTPDGVYDDETSEPEKMAMVGHGCLRLYTLTGEPKYHNAALGIGKTLASFVHEGGAEHSPLPFRVNLKTGEVLDPYTANMVSPLLFFVALASVDAKYATVRDMLWKWIHQYPLQNNQWSGYYEDVKKNSGNLNHQIPMETARFMMNHAAYVSEAEVREHVPVLIAWVRDRFGKTRRYGATSIREQDCCFKEMSSHTARYASVLAQWYGYSGKSEDAEEAMRSFALSTYSAFSKYSKNGRAVNYVGVGYIDPWFSDSYFDYLPHFLAGMAELPALAPDNASHLLGSTGTVISVRYGKNRVEYQTAESEGVEILRIPFKPRVLGNGKELDPSAWEFGDYHGASGVLHIHRANTTCVRIEATP